MLLALGVLTKSVQALLFLPGLGLYLVLRKRLIPLFRERMFYMGLGLFLFLVVGFYLLREAYNPGYLAAVWENGLFGRYGKALEGHEHPWDFYINMLIKHHFNQWWWLAPIGLVVGLLHADDRIRRATLLLATTSTMFLHVISSAGTKLEWYAAPLIPLLALLAAIPVHHILQWAFGEPWTRLPLGRWVLPWVLLLWTVCEPYATIISRCYFPKEFDWDVERYAGSYYLQRAVRGGPLEADVLCYEGYEAPLMFYVHLLNGQGRNIKCAPKHELLKGQGVLALESSVWESIEKEYDEQVILQRDGLRIYRINGRHGTTP